MKHTFLSVVFAILISPFLQAQSLEVDETRIHVDELPEYIILFSEARGITGGILLSIQEKGSEYESELSTLEDLLSQKKFLNLKNQIDLLNSMSKLGFEFVDAYTAAQSSDESLTRTGMVFRKKEKYLTD
ncbi:MAG: hypothetical protein AAGC85_24395 [Bacteroidota bacterium]